MATATTTPSPKISGKAQAPVKTRELCPEGDYLLQIAWVEKTLSQKGMPRLSFRFKVAAGTLVGKTVFEDCYLTENAMWKVANLAALCGYGENDEIDPDDASDLINKFQGKTFKGTVKHETYKNKDGVSVQATRVLWGPPPGSKKVAPAATELDSKSASDDVPF